MRTRSLVLGSALTVALAAALHGSAQTDVDAGRASEATAAAADADSAPDGASSNETPAADAATAVIDTAAAGGESAAEATEEEEIAVEIPPLVEGPEPPRPLFSDADFAATPEVVRGRLEAANAAVARLHAAVRATTDAGARTAAARAALEEIRAARRALAYHGVRFEERDGEVVGVLDEDARVGVESSVAFGAVIARAQAIEQELRSCLELFPNTCHQQLGGDLRQLGRFDAASDLNLPDGDERIASTPTMGLSALVAVYLPDPPVPAEPKVSDEGSEEEVVAKRKKARKDFELAMKTFIATRAATQQARTPHHLVNYALSTGVLVDTITEKRVRILDDGEKEDVEPAAAKELRDADDPVDETRVDAVWALIAKVEKEEADYRRELARTTARAATE